ncbi:MAG: hypothetical protein JNM17_32035 [Archangium sp.]|nr:hypothetical protein [Archangium sp.]
MAPEEQLLAQAALDVAIERICTLHPGNQSFVFGRDQTVLWTAFEPTAEDQSLFSLGRIAIQLNVDTPAPCVIKGASGHFIAMVLDAERKLFAVVIKKPQRRNPIDTRVAVPKRAGSVDKTIRS